MGLSPTSGSALKVQGPLGILSFPFSLSQNKQTLKKKQKQNQKKPLSAIYRNKDIEDLNSILAQKPGSNEHIENVAQHLQNRLDFQVHAARSLWQIICSFKNKSQYTEKNWSVAEYVRWT